MYIVCLLYYIRFHKLFDLQSKYFGLVTMHLDFTISFRFIVFDLLQNCLFILCIYSISTVSR